MTTLKTKIQALTLAMGFLITITHAQETRNVTDFTGVKAGDAFNIVITQSEVNSVKVDADEKILPQVKTEVIEGVLVISAEGNIKTDKQITINIGIKSLTNLNVSGSADVKSSNQLLCDKLKIESNGAGEVNLDTKAGEITAIISGAGDLTLKGSAQLLDANVSGAGDLRASDLETNKVKANVSGAGNARVYAVQSLNADVSGAGSIIYKGQPVDRIVNISGAGSVRESKSGTGSETARDTAKFKMGKKSYMIIEGDAGERKKHSKKDSLKDHRRDFKHWNGWEIGVNGFLDYKNSLDVPDSAGFLELDYSKSFQFGLNLMEKDFHIYKNYINLVIGLGFDFNHYSLKNNVTLNADTSYLSATNDNIDYKKNNLNVSYLKAPLMLEINTNKNPKNNIHIAAGVEVAYRIHSVTKQKYTENDKHHKAKQRDDYNLSPFRYSAIARIGYNDVTIFANYGLTRLFQKDKGPQVYPFTVGLTFAM